MSFLIMSAFRQGLSQEENLRRHHQLDATWSSILGAHPKLTLGSYVENESGKAGVELGIKIEASGSVPFPKVLQIALKLAQFFDQDSVLVVDYSKDATLVYPTGEPDSALGKWTPVSQSQALKRPYWTNISGQYFITE
ncbi:SAM-dependent methyltransferase [Ralstonia phage RSB2]|uniref:Uncharacterized protein ORF3 n=1 Tax=Ralstonia phage RSB2 TaxID=913183 RepID=E5RUY3_9CAUD|nr:SAM-dependent methyltransferase [Ralstonia phage RSB2]BAJ51791.1 hypothetical protein [Ralstonia phage RSB2]